METGVGLSAEKIINKFKSYYVVWKHFYHFFFINRAFSFKSYYVVWKRQRRKKNSLRLKCLNRTMQYGNHTAIKWRRALTPFKSYYVVWKRIKFNNTKFPYYMFKSYYVVWKPILLCLYFVVLCLFKSYYVVWKLFDKFRYAHVWICLNRTMQYGNPFFGRMFVWLRPPFKSYYVVWKLQYFHDFRCVSRV